MALLNSAPMMIAKAMKNAAAAEALGGALDAATKKVRTPEQMKAANEKSAGLRDFVRSERWTELR